MKSLVFLFCLLSCFEAFPQSRGFEFLASAKTSLESLIKLYSSTIPDTSETFKKYYLPIAFNYNKAKASYDGYRGSIKDCVFNNNSQQKIQECLKGKTVDISSQLDTLSKILNAAYFDYYARQGISPSIPEYSGHNSGVSSGDFIKDFLDLLITGTIKVWDQIKKYRKEYKESYLAEISNKEYDLAEFDQLVKGNSLVSLPTNHDPIKNH